MQFVASSLSLILCLYTIFYIGRFSYELVKDMTKANYDTNLFFLCVNFTLVVLVTIVIKQMTGGL